MTEKQAFMVCATYRDPQKPSPLRYFGILELIEDAKAQNFDGPIKLAIVDSSPMPHPFFVNPDALLKDHGIAYVHAPTRDKDAEWRKRFVEAGQFAPTDTDLKTGAKWTKLKDQMRAWDYFLPFEDEFRKIYKGPKLSDFMDFDRPAIGMKKNIGVMSLTEAFGEAAHIVFCDDDDRHHASYVKEVANVLDHASFVRPTHWATLVVKATRDQDIWGRYDVPFAKDVNGNWQIPDSHFEDVFDSSIVDGDGNSFKRGVSQKFSRPLNLAFPPLSHDGALHSYSYKTWQAAVDLFGGCAPTSFCEDMLFYRMCKDGIRGFNPEAVSSDEDLFIRCADGTNASLIEWNRPFEDDHKSDWTESTAHEIARNLSAPMDPAAAAKAGAEFLRTGKINWDILTGKPQAPAISQTGQALKNG